jgi:hypothetical protein
LYRHGDDADIHTPCPLYKVLSVPSRTLQSHNLELLVSTLNVNMATLTPYASTESSTKSLLVPKLQATSARGLPVPYPVHKTMVLGEGLDSAIVFGRFTADGIQELDEMVKVAIDLPAASNEVHSDEHAVGAPINLSIGPKALATFRE